MLYIYDDNYDDDVGDADDTLNYYLSVGIHQ